MDLYISSIPSMKTTFQTTSALVQWTLNVFMIGMGVGQIFMGPLIDRFGRRRMGLITLFLYALSSSACALSPNIYVFITARLFQAMFACGCMITTWAIIRDTTPTTKQAKTFGLLSAIIGLAPLLAPLLGGYLALWFGSFRAGFWTLSLYAFCLWTILGLLLPETLPGPMPLRWSTLAKRFSTLFQDSLFTRYSLCAGVGMSGLFSYFSVSPILLIEHWHVPAHQYGFYFGGNGLSFVLGCMMASRVQSHKGWRPLRTIRFGLKCMLMSASLIWLGAQAFQLLQMPHEKAAMWAFVLPNALSAFGVGFIFGPSMASALQHFGHMAGTASAGYSLVQFSVAFMVGSMVSFAGVQSPIPYASALIILPVMMLGMLKNSHESSGPLVHSLGPTH